MSISCSREKPQSSAPSHTPFRIARSALSCLLAACIASFALPTLAFADALVEEMEASAQVQSNGDLRVVEQRLYSFSDDHAAIRWNFSSMNSTSELKVNSVRIIRTEDASDAWDVLDQVSFHSEWSLAYDATDGDLAQFKDSIESYNASADSASRIELPPDLGWSYDRQSNSMLVFLPGEKGLMLECDYTITNAAMPFDDVAELYWDYVPSCRIEGISNISAVVNLPVPEGISVDPWKTVKAWGHGPDGTISVTEGGQVEYLVPEVLEGQYAQAHILFPAQWIGNVPADVSKNYSGTRNDNAVAEEEQWVDTWSSWTFNAFFLQLLLTLLCVLAICCALVLHALFGREHVPSKDRCKLSDILGFSPAVIGRVVRWDHISLRDFVATLMDLQQRGAISISRVEDEDSALGASYGDIRIRLKPYAADVLESALDKDAIHALFGVCAEGYQSISATEMLDFAAKRRSEFSDAMEGWQRKLTFDVQESGLFDKRSRRLRRALGIAALCAFALGCIGLIAHAMLEGAVLVATGIALALIANYSFRRTQLGCDIEANLVSRLDSLEAGIPSELIPYMYAAFGSSACVEDSSSIANDESRIDWFSPNRGIAGKQEPCLADRLTACLRDALRKANS